jgi:hypothetical protein
VWKSSAVGYEVEDKVSKKYMRALMVFFLIQPLYSFLLAAAHLFFLMKHEPAA